MQHLVKRQYRSQSLSHEAGVIDKSVYTQVERAPTSTVINNRGVATYGPTIANETIWQVAQHYKTADILLQQLILAIVGMNPQAFIEGNLNGLREGSRLQIPSTNTASKVPQELAKLEVLAHDRAWQSRQALEHALLPPYIGSAAPIATNEQGITPLGYSITISIVPAVPNFLSVLPLTSSLVSAGEPTVSLAKQLSLLQTDNKHLQQQLAQREQEMKQLRTKLHLQLAQKRGLGQVSPQVLSAGRVSVWPWIIFLLGAGGSLVYWWLWARPKSETTEELSVSSSPLPLRPIIPPPIIEKKLERDEPVLVASQELLPITEDKVSPAVVSAIETSDSAELPLEKTLADEHVLEFEPELQEVPAETLVVDVVPEAPTKRKTKLKATQGDDHNIDFVLNPVESLPAEESAKPLKSKVALDTLLALAETYIGMEDFEAAKQSLQEVLNFGSKKQKLDAKELLTELSKKK